MKVALVHDYLKEYGGAERVLEALHQIFPEAPVFTAYYNPKSLGQAAQRFKDWDIRVSFLQKIPGANKLISPFRLFAPLFFESFDLKEYDVVISSCNIYFAKAVLTKPETLHLSYIHTPPRYLYGYTTSFNYKKNILTRVGGELINHILRIFDYETSQRPNILIANSKNVSDRIKKFYRRDSVVINPPVDLDEFKIQERGAKNQEKKYFLALNRLVRGKGTEIIVEAFNKADLPLKVAGSGPELEKLKKQAGVNIEFLGHITDEERVKLLAGAKALVVASEDEDFGITAVESQAAGTPVIAPKTGGYLETIIDGKTGTFFAKDANSLIKTLENFDEAKFKKEDLQKNAAQFSEESFKKKILDLIDKNLKSH